MLGFSHCIYYKAGIYDWKFDDTCLVNLAELITSDFDIKQIFQIPPVNVSFKTLCPIC